MADGSAFHANRPRVLKGFRCAGCDEITHLADLNGQMLCPICGEPDEDEDFIDTSVAAMRAQFGTWSV